MNIIEAFRSRIGFKIVLPALVVILLFGIPVYFGYRYAQVTGELNDEVWKENRSLLTLAGIEKNLREEMVIVHETVFENDAEAFRDFSALADETGQLTGSARENAEETADAEALAKFESQHQALKSIFFNQMVPVWQAGDNAALQEEEEAFYGYYREMLGTLAGLSEIHAAKRDAALIDREEARADTSRVAILGFAAAVFFSLLVAILVTRRITRPLKQVAAAAVTMGKGDLGQRVKVSVTDEVGQMATSFNAMAETLQRRTSELVGTKEAIERRKSELEALTAVSAVAVGTLDLEEMTDAVLDKILEVVNTDAAAFHLLDRYTGELVMTASRNLPDALAGDLERLKKGEGCPGYVWEIGRALVETDLRGSDKVPQTALDAGLLSYVGAPLTSKKEIVGVISLGSGRLEAFDDEDARLLSLIGSHVGMAVENADLYDKSIEHSAKTVAKNRIMSVLTSSLDMGEVYANFAAELKQLVDYTCVSITELVNGGSLRVVSSHGDRPDDCVTGFTFDAGGTPMLAAIEGLEPFVTGDIENDNRITAKEFFLRAGFKSIISLPMVIKGKVLGTMNMASNKKEAFNDKDVRELLPVVYQVALALDNQKLFSDIERAKMEWETTFDSVGDGIVMVNNDKEVVRLNKAAAELLGGTVEEFLGRSCCDVMHGLDKEIEECMDESFIQEIKTFKSQRRMEDGRILEVTADIVLDEEENGTGLVYIVRDVTESERLRRQLVQSEKMVAVGELVSGVAHEINNPLTGVLGYAQLLAARDIDESTRKDAEGIMREAERATRIVRQLLSFARKHEPERSMTDVNAALMESLELKAYDLRVNNINLETDLDESLPGTMADKYQLQQVFLNIISNAEQAMLGHNGAGLLKVSSKIENGRIRLAFADDGPGIPEEIRNRVFDPFFTTKDVGKGTGLGLSVCYGIVEEHDGNIWVEPTPGGGSTFVIGLPVVNGHSTPQQKVDKPDKEAVRPGKILLVDDEEGIRQALTRILRQAGHMVETADNGKTALAMLKRDHFDCIVSDIKMPHMDGPTLHREVKLLDPRLGGSFIFISGDTINSETQSYLDEVENPHLTKPFNAADLEDVLKKVLNGG